MTRKRKLLEKQKAGKERLKTAADIDMAEKAFMTVLYREDQADTEGCHAARVL